MTPSPEKMLTGEAMHFIREEFKVLTFNYKRLVALLGDELAAGTKDQEPNRERSQ